MPPTGGECEWVWVLPKKKRTNACGECFQPQRDDGCTQGLSSGHPISWFLSILVGRRAKTTTAGYLTDCRISTSTWGRKDYKLSRVKTWVNKWQRRRLHPYPWLHERLQRVQRLQNNKMNKSQSLAQAVQPTPPMPQDRTSLTSVWSEILHKIMGMIDEEEENCLFPL